MNMTPTQFVPPHSIQALSIKRTPSLHPAMFWVLALGFIVLLLPLSNLHAMQDQKQTLAVMEFEGFGVDQFAVKTLTDRFRSKAVADGTFRIMERGAMDEILDEQKFQLSGCTSDECIVEMGQFLGVQYMLGATVGRVGDTFAISMRMISVESGEIIKTANFDITGKIDRLLTEGISEAAKLMFGSLKKADASVVISTLPAGARLFLGGADRGLAPVDLQDLKAETPYDISIQLDDHKTFDTTLVLVEGRNNRIVLPLIRETGELSVEGSPENSKIFLGKSLVGKIPLLSFTYPTGEYELSVKKPGFQTFTNTIALETDQSLPIVVSLIPKSKKKAILFSTLLPGSGQLYQGYKGKGILLLASTLATAYLAFEDYGTFVESKTVYEEKSKVYNSNLTQPDLLATQKQDMLDAFDIMKDHESAFLLKAGLVGGIWTVNLLEIAF